MGFFTLWFKKLWVYLIYRFVKAVEIKPFLTIDPNQYCPCCGHRSGRIGAASDGQTVNCRHICGVCGWIWDEQTVTQIEPSAIISVESEVEEDSDKSDVTELQARTGRRFVRIPAVGEEGVKVNGQAIPDRVTAPVKPQAKNAVARVV